VQQYTDNVNQLLEIGEKNSVAILGNNFLTIISSLQVIQNSWQLKDVNCAHQNCAVTWLRSYGTYEHFVQDTSIDPQSLTFMEDGGVITQTITTDVQPESGDKLAELNIESLPSSNHFFMKVGSLFQQYNSVGINTQIRPRAIFGIVPGAPTPPAIPGGFVQQGTWLLSGDYVFATEVVSQIPNNMTLEGFSVTLETEGSLKFKLEGNYYVRN
jgi:hypothetical protein